MLSSSFLSPGLDGQNTLILKLLDRASVNPANLDRSVATMISVDLATWSGPIVTGVELSVSVAFI